ncbi:MAG: nitroreductase family protein [Clostridia bacterium]|nr:nitroreductase family protein [Clostridia bacterium]
MNFQELVFSRTSTRAFTGSAIPAEHIRLILEAGLRAPNACNLQSWHLYCVLGKEKVAALTDAVCHQKWIANAAFVVVITEDTNALSQRFGKEAADRFAAQDSGAAAENMLLMATELGYGGCFVGAFDPENCRAFVNAPTERTPVLLLPVGVPSAPVVLRDRKPFDETVTFIGEMPEVSAPTIEEKPFELQCASLPGAVFDDLNLESVSFHNINMSGAKFDDINLGGATFGNINLSDSSFGGLCMNRARFGCVELNGAGFENVELDEVVFKNCSMRGAKLENVDITGMTVNGKPIGE